MKNMKKIIVVAMAVAMLALAATAGTMAWLHDNAAMNYEVKSYGDVSINLTGIVYEDGLYLIPNGVYNFDPTVTIVSSTSPAENEDFFLRMFVTVDHATDWKQLIADGVVNAYAGTTIMDIEYYTEQDDAHWTMVKAAEVNDTFVYEFRYSYDETVWVPATANNIHDVFQGFRLDERLNDDDVARLQGTKITFEAQAMQAVKQQIFGQAEVMRDYFSDAQDAWLEFDAQIGTAYKNPVQELVTSTQNGNIPYTPGKTLQ